MSDPKLRLSPNRFMNLVRGDGRRSYNFQKGRYPIKLQAALLLIERFAEHRKNVGNVFPQEAHIGANMPWRSTQGNTAAWIKGDEADTADSKAAEWKEWGNSLQIGMEAGSSSSRTKRT
uniref:Uncharacterized protein n=1 Tax=Melanopsichium pennsylvanicum 4 TaxID=1398559 RepID=A0A077R3E2_9BASI|nr:uncharacterized protein BN887_01107 [Melanopsichium pennsylvanicum 4]